MVIYLYMKWLLCICILITAVNLEAQSLYPKLSPALQQGLERRQTGGHTVFQLSVNDTAGFRAFLAAHLQSVKVAGFWRSANLFRIVTTERFLYDSLLPLPAVIFADRGDKQAKEESIITDFNNSFNTINTVHALYPALNGDGLTVSVKENNFDTADIDFSRRIVGTGIASATISPHATTMATLIGGAGNSYYTGRGVAWKSQLSSADFSVLLPDTAAYQQYGITVQNHSYGVEVENFYGSDAAAYDASMLEDTVLLPVFSAGNSGNTTPADGLYKGLAGFANLTGSFKMAKNIVTVGAVDSFYTVAALSSRGPAYDGRVKPELAAYGQDGSSGAAALVSGTALLLQQAYRNTHSNQLPASALVKALLLNSADAIDGQGPHYASGYGVLNAQRAVENMLAGRFAAGAVQQQQVSSFSLAVPANACNLKIMLVWNDVPAAANAAKALVNDLDLTVQLNGNNWLPWVLSSYPAADSLLRQPVRRRDSINVAEQISIDTPQAGNYVVQVKGSSISKGSQRFYVVWQWDTLYTFHFTSPARADNFLAGSTNIFKWNSHFPAGEQGRLDISYDAGLHWLPVTEKVSLDAPYYRWNTTDTCAAAIARMVIGADVFVSDTFTVSRQAYPAVGFNCGDSLLLHWPVTTGAAGYRLLTLSGAYLLPVLDTQDSFAILHQPNTTQPYYAVAPLVPNYGKGVNSYAVNYTQQGVSCFFNNFLADVYNEHSAVLNLQLGVLYSLQTIRFEKQTADGWQTLQTIPVGTGLNYSITDSLLTNGLNTYRAVLSTTSGALLYSDPSTVYYWKNGDYVFFPNPVARHAPLQLLSKQPFNKWVCLYDMNGRKVLQQPVNNTLEQLAVNRLMAGTYIAVVLDGGKKATVQKIVIQ